MNIVTDFIPKPGDAVERLLPSGGAYICIWVICPRCGEGRWVSKAYTRKSHFTGYCQKCNGIRCITKLKECLGRYKNVQGYILVRVEKDSPFFPMIQKKEERLSKDWGYVPEHRLVMAQHLGRCLTDDEVVHHKPPGIKDDNRYENLELLGSHSEHSRLRRSHYHSRLKELRERVTILEAEVVLLREQLELEGSGHGI